jgi:eukaryotic-like serine/threonine-protein kinase
MVWQSGKKLNNGRYIIERVLGEGGFGITYLAKDEYHTTQVAIKTLNDSVKNSPEFEKLHQDFQKEAELLQSCVHPNVVKIHDLFLEEDLFLGLFSKGKPVSCMVMEYISDGDLSKRVDSSKTLSESQALSYINQVGEVLKFIHTKGILHRDIKPNNIMIRSNGTVALIDFGIARSFIEGKTQTQTQFVTPGYSPPEQWIKRERRGAYTDVYALAATLYFLLTGSPPQFNGSNLELKPPKQLKYNISDSVNQAIINGMQWKPEDRPQSVEEWLKMLSPQKPKKQKSSVTSKSDSHPTNNYFFEEGWVQTIKNIGWIVLFYEVFSNTHFDGAMDTSGLRLIATLMNVSLLSVVLGLINPNLVLLRFGLPAERQAIFSLYLWLFLFFSVIQKFLT